MTCPICRKDLTAAVNVLGEENVEAVHKQAHVQEAIQRLLDKSWEWPELSEHFEPLRKAMEL